MDVVQKAYEDAGYVQEGSRVTDDQIIRGLARLNDLIALYQTQGLKLWLESDVSVTLVASQEAYDLMPGGDVDMVRPLRVKQAYYLSSSGNRRPLGLISRDEYTRLGHVNQVGELNSVFVEKLVDRLRVHPWQMPSAAAALGTLHLIVHQQAHGLTSVSHTTGFPPEWVIALRWGLADEICTGQPAEIVQRCAQRASAFRTALEDFDVEDTETFFQPDSRYSQPSRFR